MYANIYNTEQHPQSLDKQAADIAKVFSWASKNFKALEIQLASLQTSVQTSGSTPEAAAAETVETPERNYETRDLVVSPETALLPPVTLRLEQSHPVRFSIFTSQR